jgi:hypothetical protein
MGPVQKNQSTSSFNISALSREAIAETLERLEEVKCKLSLFGYLMWGQRCSLRRRRGTSIQGSTATVDPADPPGKTEDFRLLRKIADQYCWYDFSSTKVEPQVVLISLLIAARRSFC